jgi:hypothetical protein
MLYNAFKVSLNHQLGEEPLKMCIYDTFGVTIDPLTEETGPLLQSLQAFFRLPCSQIPLPLHSVHLYL